MDSIARFAVTWLDSHGKRYWHAIGKGSVEGASEAHLFTSLKLATEKRDQYAKQPRHYKMVKIVPFVCYHEANLLH